MAAAVPLIGIGASVIGQVAGMSQQQRQQQRQADTNSELQLQDALAAEHRAQLAVQRYAQVKQSAQLLRDREMQIISAQRRAADLSIEQSKLENKASQINSQYQASQLRNQGAATLQTSQQNAELTRQNARNSVFDLNMAASDQVGQNIQQQTSSQNELSQSVLGGANAQQLAGQGLQQVSQLSGQMGATGKSTTGQTLQQNALLDATSQWGALVDPMNQQQGQSRFNADMAANYTGLARTNADITQRYGLGYMDLANQSANNISAMGALQQQGYGIGADTILGQQGYVDQQLNYASTNQYQINALQAKRNRVGVKTGYQQSLSEGSTSALAAVMQERANIANAYANQQQGNASVQRAGIGDYAGVVAGGIMGAYQVLSQPRVQQQTQPRNVYGLSSPGLLNNTNTNMPSPSWSGVLNRYA